MAAEGDIRRGTFSHLMMEQITFNPEAISSSSEAHATRKESKDDPNLDHSESEDLYAFIRTHLAPWSTNLAPLMRSAARQGPTGKEKHPSRSGRRLRGDLPAHAGAECSKECPPSPGEDASRFCAELYPHPVQ